MVAGHAEQFGSNARIKPDHMQPILVSLDDVGKFTAKSVALGGAHEAFRDRFLASCAPRLYGPKCAGEPPWAGDIIGDYVSIA